MNKFFIHRSRAVARYFFLRSRRMGLALVASTTLALVACGGDGSSPPPTEPTPPTDPVASYTVSGTVSGLKGSGLVLQTETGQTLAVATDGLFTLPSPLVKGATYVVTVKSQPTSPLQTCSVGNASGTMGDADITNLQVTCSTDAFAITGNVSGLAGSGLVIQNNAGDDLAIQVDGHFAFPIKVASGARYAVTVKAQPGTPAQTCTVTQAAGTVVERNVADVAIVCATNTYTIGGSVSGLNGRPGLVLQNNASDDLAVASDGAFIFATPVASGGSSLVTVKTSPVGLACTVTPRPAMPVTANVTDVQVICSPVMLRVGGILTGMTGTGLVLQNNGADDLVLSANGTFNFAAPVASGSPYAVSIKAQPTLETCTVTNGSGTATAAVTNVSITCISLQVTTLAGNGTRATVDGVGTATSFNQPAGIASDAAGNLYVSQFGDGALRKISPAGNVTTLTTGLTNAVGVAVSPSGEIYVAARGIHTIVKVSPTGTITTFAGRGTPSSVDGIGTAASFNYPNGLAFDSVGNLYVSEVGGHRIRKVSPAGDVTTLAGNGSSIEVDGTGTAASFNTPSHITVGPDGNVYVAGNQGHNIRKVTPAGVVTTLAGSVNGIAGSANGTGVAASFNTPFGIAVDAAGMVYVAELLGNKIRQIDPHGVVTTLAGTGMAGSANGAANTATFNGPAAVLVDAQNNIVIVEHSGNRIRKFSR